MSWLETVGVREQADEIVVAVQGEDARTWLNGQITNDLKRLPAGGSVYGLFLTTKGRVLADVLVTEAPGGLHMLVDRAVWPALREQLEKYIIMEDVTLHETDLAVTSLVGPQRGALDLDEALASMGASSFAAQRVGGPSVEVLAPTAVAPALRAKLVTAAEALGGARADDAGWELARIQHGVPRFPADFGERTYPQEAGLKRSALAFDKGCYLGQEVVCMLESRGQVTRSLVRLTVDGAGRIAIGEPVRDAAGEAIGEITSAAPEGDRTRALGYVKRAVLEQGRPIQVSSRAATIEGPAG